LPMRWEYAVEYFTSTNDRPLASRLNEKGAEGWELVAVSLVAIREEKGGNWYMAVQTTPGGEFRGTAYHECVFKRPIG
jgi:hypothetical protein